MYEKKEHWIKNTSIAKKCRENENVRNIVIVIIVIIIFVAIISAISAYSTIGTVETSLVGTRDISRINSLNDEINVLKIRIVASIVVAILVWHYGKKIVEKESEFDTDENVSNSTNKYEELEKLQKLKDNGTITAEEFESEKQKILK